MPRRYLNHPDDNEGEDWIGNNAAFQCKKCNKTFIVSSFLHPTGRECPRCQGSIGHVSGSLSQLGSAWISWED